MLRLLLQEIVQEASATARHAHSAGLWAFTLASAVRMKHPSNSVSAAADDSAFGHVDTWTFAGRNVDEPVITHDGAFF
jgi:hypothetical protein